jgi:hypothetical protein
MAVAVSRGVSGSVVDHWIGKWRLARLSRDLGHDAGGFLGRLVELGPVAMLSGLFGSNILSLFFVSQLEKDAVVVQDIVDQMPEEMRSAFVAYHLAVIRDERCRDLPHKVRARILGIPPTTYFRRVEFGREYIAQRLPD